MIRYIRGAMTIAEWHKENEHVQAKRRWRGSFIAPKARFLVVDDNMLNRKVFVKLLQHTKIQIDEAESGFECIDKMKEYNYDIVFLDHMMPEMDGRETLKRLKEIYIRMRRR